MMRVLIASFLFIAGFSPFAHGADAGPQTVSFLNWTVDVVCPLQSTTLSKAGGEILIIRRVSSSENVQPMMALVTFETDGGGQNQTVVHENFANLDRQTLSAPGFQLKLGQARGTATIDGIEATKYSAQLKATSLNERLKKMGVRTDQLSCYYF